MTKSHKRMSIENKSLLKACEEGDLLGVQDAIDAGADINCKDEWGYPGGPIYIATTKGHNDILNLLITNKADVKRHGGAALIETIKYGNKEGATLLLGSGAPLTYNGDTAARAAAIHGNTEIMEELLKQNADIYLDKEPFLSACGNGETNMVKFLIRNNVDIENLKETAFFELCNLGFDGERKGNKKTMGVILSYFTPPELKELSKINSHPFIKKVANNIIKEELNLRKLKDKVKSESKEENGIEI